MAPASPARAVAIVDGDVFAPSDNLQQRYGVTARGVLLCRRCASEAIEVLAGREVVS